MTLFAEIQTKCDQALIDSKDYQAIADVVNVGRTRSQKTAIGEGTILDVLGMAVGNAFLDVIDTVADYRHVKKIISRGDFDVSTTTSQTGIQAMVPAVLTQGQADNLKALGIVPAPVGVVDVALALENGV